MPYRALSILGSTSFFSGHPTMTSRSCGNWHRSVHTWTKHIRVLKDLQGQCLVVSNHDHSVATILQFVSFLFVFLLSKRLVVMRPVDENCNPLQAFTLIEKVRFAVHAFFWPVLGAVRKPVFSGEQHG